MKYLNQIDGFININKDAGISSHDAVAAVRRLLRCKVGHAGTLDPAATGVLPICLGKATRLAEYVGLCSKSYRGEITFGITTDSYDRAGEVISRKSAEHLSLEDIKAALPRFRGQIMQEPPMVSALKYQGRPLYKFAREGVNIDRAPREVSIYDLGLVSWEIGGPHPRITLDIHCSKGTYIRSIAHDMGEALGVGAHLSALCRTFVGPFLLDNALTLEQFASLLEAGDESWLLPMSYGISHIPEIIASNEQVSKLIHGNTIFLDGEQEPYPLCRINTLSGELIGMGKIEKDDAGSFCLVINKVLVGAQ